MKLMIEASCHCGAVRYEVEAAPEAVTSCACSICRRYGTLWAYYSPKQVRAAGATDIYLSGGTALECQRCKLCGSVTHWASLDKPHDRMGVNARLMDPAIVAAAKLRHIDGPA
jgi:hypothetical protein